LQRFAGAAAREYVLSLKITGDLSRPGQFQARSQAPVAGSGVTVASAGGELTGRIDLDFDDAGGVADRHRFVAQQRDRRIEQINGLFRTEAGRRFFEDALNTRRGCRSNGWRSTSGRGW
jgi:hypothetical protein